jgi:hypothetical protein
MGNNHDRHGQHVYGSLHKAVRKRWALVVAAGGVFCWRCGKPIPPGSRWDLGHVDEEGRRLGFPDRHPEHVACNRRTMSHLREGLARADRFGGLPDPEPQNEAVRWSRHWDSGRFNPRCPDCRERGSMCERALELAREEVGGAA